jgi:hypothetical protein
MMVNIYHYTFGETQRIPRVNANANNGLWAAMMCECVCSSPVTRYCSSAGHWQWGRLCIGCGENGNFVLINNEGGKKAFQDELKVYTRDSRLCLTVFEQGLGEEQYIYIHTQLVWLEFELRALHLQSRHSTPPVCFALVILEMGSHELFAQAGLKP